jgi:hypothetical protein
MKAGSSYWLPYENSLPVARSVVNLRKELTIFAATLKLIVTSKMYHLYQAING